MDRAPICPDLPVTASVFSNFTQKSNKLQPRVISGFCQEVDKNRALRGYYAASSGNFLPTFRDNISGPIFKGCSKTSVRNYFYSPHNNPEERSFHAVTRTLKCLILVIG